MVVIVPSPVHQSTCFLLPLVAETLRHRLGLRIHSPARAQGQLPTARALCHSSSSSLVAAKLQFSQPVTPSIPTASGVDPHAPLWLPSDSSSVTRAIFQKHMLDHRSPPLDTFNGSPVALKYSFFCKIYKAVFHLTPPLAFPLPSCLAFCTPAISS